MRATARFLALALALAATLAACDGAGPAGPASGSGTLTPSDDSCDPVVLPC